MYPLIIVDDERGCRELLREYVNNSSLDFHVTGLFSNGESALEYMSSNLVKVVLTDIRMEHMDGLDLSQTIRKRYPSCKIVLISGYNQWEYAKQAILCGVVNYILKPINTKELFHTLSIIYGQLQEEEKEKQERVSLMELRREQFFSELLSGCLSNTQDLSEAYASLRFQVPLEQVRLLTFCWDTEYPLSEENNETILSKLPSLLELSSGAFWSSTISDAYYGWVFILLFDNQTSIPSPETLTSSFSSVLDIGNYKLTPLFKGLLTEGSLPVFGNNISHLFSLTLSHLAKNNVPAAQKDIRMLTERLPGLEKLPGLDYISNLFHGKVPNYLSVVVDESEDLEDPIILRAKQFISNNYAKDITRDDVAEHIYLNSSYFSRYFKLKTGQCFFDYLNQFRIEKSLKLLNSRMRLNDIAEQVGYHHTKYYRKHFKNYTGYTPSEYRRQVLRIYSAEVMDDDEE